MENIANDLMLCLAICGQDGLVSESEEERLFCIFNKNLNLGRQEFDAIVELFFASNYSLEQLFSKSSGHSDLLEWAKDAASADGLDIRENIAYQKCVQLL